MTNEQIQALKGNQVIDPYYLVECGNCAEIYPSNKLGGGGQIADTGDYGSCYCPHCDAGDDYEDLGNSAAEAWNYQQKHIESLLAEREADKALIAKLQNANAAQDEHINQQADRIGSLEKTNRGLGKRLCAVEARTLTVNPPERCECCYSEQESALFDGVVEEYTEALESACAAAGITLVVGGEDGHLVTF